ncbi:hypothetical protein [Mucilaginibacter rubeus]|uniref:hypothetical protein n=1 Tax=Mucilaginibacter rubeus TaxID=2027860 RepID=UPI001681651D|nr:hypothetical protein [Mucilaginibacter rubeus]
MDLPVLIVGMMSVVRLGNMATTSVLGTVYETLLCSPGMNESVKIDGKISRKTFLLLNSVIENALSKDGNVTSELLKLVPADEQQTLRTFGEDCLNKTGLKELSDKMKSLSEKQVRQSGPSIRPLLLLLKLKG